MLESDGPINNAGCHTTHFFSIVPAITTADVRRWPAHRYMFLEHDEHKYIFKIIFICNLNKKTISTIGCGTPTSLLIEASLLPDVSRNNCFLHILFVTSVVIPQTDSNYSCWATSNLVPRGYVERGLLHFTWLLAMFRNAGDSDFRMTSVAETIRFSKATVQIQQFKDER